jgi:hypothetical protein
MTNSVDDAKSTETILADLKQEIAREKTRLAHGSDENRASRLYIMKHVMIIYVVVLVTLAISLVLGGIFSKDWAAATRGLTEVATTLVLPVVTLVLGYYFGREGRDQNRS